MATDYILFVHGVNTREERERPEYADPLFTLIQESVSDRDRDLNKVVFYWGNLKDLVDAETKLLERLKASPLWEQMWFRTFREQQILQFAGDAALYISRHVGSQLVKKLKADIGTPHSDDRLHLVTHSWGTVIIFDILFAGRWDDPNVPGHDEVMAIRDAIFGISGYDPNPHQGIQLASIHTMGSPVAIFSLTDVSASGHDITPKLQELLENLHAARRGEKLPWRNYIHPGDPIAYPLKELITSMVDSERKYLDIQDLITHEAGIFDFLNEPISQTTLALLHGGKAHGSYWNSEKVAQAIAKVLM
jgi:hypothetical protein